MTLVKVEKGPVNRSSLGRWCLWLIGLFWPLLVTPGCASIPGVDRIQGAWEVYKEVKPISEAEEIDMGRAAVAENWWGIPESDEAIANTYLTKVGKVLAKVSRRPQLPYEFSLADSFEVNGWSYVGGFVRVTRGMAYFLYNEAELACLLGHEIAHASERHVAKRLERARRSRLVSRVLSERGAPLFETYREELREIALKGLGRRDELEADRVGAMLAQTLGYDPWAFAGLFERMTRRVKSSPVKRNWQTFQKGHVDSITRARALRKYLEEQGIRPGQGRRGEQEYRRFVLALWARSRQPFTPEEIRQEQPDILGTEEATNRAGPLGFPPVTIGKDILVKSGASVETLHPDVKRILKDVVEVWKGNRAPPPIITSGNDGIHPGSGNASGLDCSTEERCQATSDSLHYKDLAIDLRTRDIQSADQKRKIRQDLKATLGEDYRVELEYLGTEREHMHIGYHPRRP